ncbi:MAG TPA: rhombosortase, partial [Steroidobacteraceae bacterium]|nr:rhombosortase [Steroidobacteraceae bacterium]
MHRLNLARLARFDVRSWYATLGLAALMIALQLLGTVEREFLPYDRSAILADGEYARLVSAHFYHYDFAHLAWNLAGLALVAWLFAAEFSTRGWAVILLASAAVVDLGFLVLEPQLEWYVGFSGVLHGLAAAGLVAWLMRTRDTITAIVAAVYWVFVELDTWINLEPLLDRRVPGAGIVATIAVITVVGFLASNFATRWIFAGIE